MRKFSKFVFLLFLITGGFYSNSSLAGPLNRNSHRIQWEYETSDMVAQKSKIISSIQAKKIAEERFGGKALSATLEKYDNENSAYRVKMINGGRVKVVTIPANP